MEHKSNMCLILCGEIYMLNLDDALLFEADDHYTEIHKNNVFRSHNHYFMFQNTGCTVIKPGNGPR